MTAAPDPRMQAPNNGHEDSLWEMLNPCAMFRCRPEEFRGYTQSICPGIFWLPGITCLFLIHCISFQSFFTAWPLVGTRAFGLLIPLAILWVWFCAADVKFRLQGPTRQEQAGFDNAVVNWFGFVVTLLGYLVILPVAVLVTLWNWIA